MKRAEFLLDEMKTRISTDNRYLYTAGADFELGSGDGFFIEVPAAGGSVKYTTMGGQTNTETMSGGYHPVRFKKIFAATTINLGIVW